MRVNLMCIDQRDHLNFELGRIVEYLKHPYFYYFYLHKLGYLNFMNLNNEWIFKLLTNNS